MKPPKYTVPKNKRAACLLFANPALQNGRGCQNIQALPETPTWNIGASETRDGVSLLRGLFEWRSNNQIDSRHAGGIVRELLIRDGDPESTFVFTDKQDGVSLSPGLPHTNESGRLERLPGTAVGDRHGCPLITGYHTVTNTLSLEKHDNEMEPSSQSFRDAILADEFHQKTRSHLLVATLCGRHHHRTRYRGMVMVFMGNISRWPAKTNCATRDQSLRRTKHRRAGLVDDLGYCCEPLGYAGAYNRHPFGTARRFCTNHEAMRQP